MNYNTVNIRNDVPKRKQTRNPSVINKIVVHYTATDGGDFWSFWNNRWKGLGWITGGYAEIILANNNVQLCYPDNMMTNGARGQNSKSLHIAYVGRGAPTARQREILIDRVLKAMDRLGLTPNDVYGHRELPGQSTPCPPMDMNQFRNDLRNGSSTGGSFMPTNITLGKDCNRFICRGHSVTMYQSFLSDLGYNLGGFGADGVFGNATESDTRDFQSKHGLTVDGIAGRQTLTKLNDVLEKEDKEEIKEELKSEVLEDYHNHWAKENIQKLVELGIVKGHSDGTIRPDSKITRAEFFTVIDRFLND